jgi:hypothetical protein
VNFLFWVAVRLDSRAAIRYDAVIMDTQRRCDQHNLGWYFYYFTPPALLVGRSVLIR